MMEHQPECPSATNPRFACYCPSLHSAMERARIAERVGLGPLWRGGAAEVERDTRERIEALLVSEGYDAAAFVVACMRPDGRAGHRDPDPGFPPHEHAGDAHDPGHCVWTRADGERCMAPLVWVPTFAPDERPTLRSAILQAVGTASVCWKAPPTSHGEFDSEMAQWVADGLLAFITGGWIKP